MNLLIVSKKFGPGHINHLKAWYKLCRACGYSAKLYLDERYKDYFEEDEYDYTVELSEVESYRPHGALIYNTGFENVSFINWCAKNNCPIIYVLHEPYMGLRELLKDGSYMVKQLIASLLNVWICHKSSRVILCSEYAEENCAKYMKKTRKKAVRFPLIFLDDYDSRKVVERTYFSMIGGCSTAHGSDVFIEYIKRAYESGSNQKFQIVTRSNILHLLSDPVYKKMQNSGHLVVQQGRPLTEKEMSAAYRCSIATWNGYRRSTQSGVLPNSLMHGTPVVATKVGSFKEFVKPCVTGVFISDFKLETITDAVNQIRQEGDVINHSCRKFFGENFYYRNQIDKFKKIVETI